MTFSHPRLISKKHRFYSNLGKIKMNGANCRINCSSTYGYRRFSNNKAFSMIIGDQKLYDKITIRLLKILTIKIVSKINKTIDLFQQSLRV